MYAKLALAVTLLAGLASQALAYSGKATSYAKAGQAINGGGTGFNVRWGALLGVARALAACVACASTLFWLLAYAPPPNPPSPPQACEFHSLPGHWMDYYAALSYKIYSSGKCGKCAEVCGNGNCVVVKVVDECASCHSSGHIDLSEPAMKVLTGHGYDEVSVSWNFVSCGSGSSSRKQKKKKKHHRGLLASEQ